MPTQGSSADEDDHIDPVALERTVGPNVPHRTTGDTVASYSLSYLSEITARRFNGEMQLATPRKTTAAK